MMLSTTSLKKQIPSSNNVMNMLFPLSMADWRESGVNVCDHTQGIESDIICNLMKGRGKSIHDAILSRASDAQENIQLMKQYFFEMVGIEIDVKLEVKENIHLKKAPKPRKALYVMEKPYVHARPLSKPVRIAS
jgi:hypothetical protein